MKKFLVFLVILGGLTAGVAYFSNNTLFEDMPKTANGTALQENITIQHPNWKDELIQVEGNRIRRKNGTDHGQVQNITPESFEIVWDRWGIESFQKNPETGIYHLSGKRDK